MLGRKGFVILLAGPDGAGKSTVVGELEAALSETELSHVRQHYRPNVVVPRRSQGDASQPHEGKEGSLPRACAKLALTWLDVLVGLHLSASRRNDVVLVERGWWDQAVDPRRYRLPAAASAVTKALGRLTPRADLALLLVADAEVVHARKPELEPSEYSRQAHAWTETAPRAAREVIHLRTDRPILETRRTATAVVRSRSSRQWTTSRVLPSPRRLSMRATSPPCHSLEVWQPDTRRSRLAKRIAATAHGRFSVGSRAAALESVFADRLGLNGVQSVTVFRGSAPGRRIVAYAGNSGLLAVCKASPEGTDPGLVAEGNILSSWTPLESLSVPRLLHAGPVVGWDLVATAPLPSSDRAVRADDAVQAAVQLQRCQPPMVHGDLAPWNLRSTPAGLYLWDWEHARIQRFPLYDILHFLLSDIGLVRRKGAEQACSELLGKDSPVRRVAEILDVDLTTELRRTLPALRDLPDRRADVAHALLRQLSCEY